MSSNQKKDDHKGKRRRSADQQKRMSSVTRKLHWYGIRKRTAYLALMDVCFFLLACVGWCADQEYTRLGEFVLKNQRGLVLAAQTGVLSYRVASPAGRMLFTVPFQQPFFLICGVTGGLFLLQMTGQLFSYFREDKKIRKILSPINEIALKADQLSRLSFTEDKYQEIERALENIQPGQVQADQPLSFGDSDLAGVEAAMNNLLLRMRDTYRQQARFVNDASHELRTPIAVILGYANMLDRWGKSNPQTLEEGITAIKNETEHMSHLVEQLLFLARGDSGKTSLEIKQINACDLMREVYEESFLIDENHRYRLKLPNQEIHLQADYGMLKQAVRILIDNSAKYTPAGEEILLSAGFGEDGCPYLQVQDIGIGIAQEEVSHIFDRFYRSDEVRSSAGSGLGLSIAKWIVEKHGGHFEILSRKDLGTRIRIVMPAP